MECMWCLHTYIHIYIYIYKYTTDSIYMMHCRNHIHILKQSRASSRLSRQSHITIENKRTWFTATVVSVFGLRRVETIVYVCVCVAFCFVVLVSLLLLVFVEVTRNPISLTGDQLIWCVPVVVCLLQQHKLMLMECRTSRMDDLVEGRSTMDLSKLYIWRSTGTCNTQQVNKPNWANDK